MKGLFAIFVLFVGAFGIGLFAYSGSENPSRANPPSATITAATDITATAKPHSPAPQTQPASQIKATKKPTTQDLGELKAYGERLLAELQQTHQILQTEAIQLRLIRARYNSALAGLSISEIISPVRLMNPQTYADSRQRCQHAQAAEDPYEHDFCASLTSMQAQVKKAMGTDYSSAGLQIEFEQNTDSHLRLFKQYCSNDRLGFQTMLAILDFAEPRTGSMSIKNGALVFANPGDQIVYKSFLDRLAEISKSQAQLRQQTIELSNHFNAWAKAYQANHP